MSRGFGRQPQDKATTILSNGELFCGIVQHSVTGRWQTWMSFHGTDIGCVTAHKSREDADNVARQIVAAWESGLENQEKVTAFMRSLPSDDVPDPLPQDVVMRLSKKIR
ncbi:MAG: hypothetical protein DSM106950_45180 [Stigonema ocellatum SAG 48.90 = DSM 106950]|nr:hypothetical protein [Stigonema ocellatum SAG 48.90 = DSM 106950]